MDKYIGRLLDNRYEILEVIGTGGMAVVYKARCHRLNRLVAIKILKDDYMEDEDFRRRFHSESQAVAMLGHPNIVAVYDVSSGADADYIVMELIDGITLKQYMEKKGVLNWKETLHFSIQIAKALEHAHSRGIVHRDIKPHNVMVLKNGSVKVTDFGIARVMSKGNTLTKEALGSVHYISPEQAKGGRVDVRSDIYSLGVVMYEMMSGRPPYDGESPVSVAIQHINGGAVMPSTYNPNIPGGLEQIIMKAMAHDTDNRFESTTAMLADMDEFRKDPTMLFEYNTPPLDEVTRLTPPPVVTEAPKTTAEKVAQRADPQLRKAKTGAATAEAEAQRRRRSAQRRRQEAQAKRDNVATIAIIACSLVAVIAIGIFLLVLFGGGLTAPQSQTVQVPYLEGEFYDPDMEMPEGLTLKAQDPVFNDEYEAGRIISQEPHGGVFVAPGNTVYVKVSKGPQPEPIKMPELQGLEQSVAQNQLKNLDLDLQVEIPTDVYSDTVPAGVVMRTVPSHGTELSSGQTVTLYVSQGPKVIKAKVPNVVGMDLDRAIRVLDAAGFGTPDYELVTSAHSKGEVIYQSVEKNTEVDVNTVITLKVSKGPEETTEPTTEPTQPTEEQTVIKTLLIELPDGMVEPYVLTITNGGAVVHEFTVQPDSLYLEVEVKGTGIQYYKINIPGIDPVIKEVDFTAE